MKVLTQGRWEKKLTCTGCHSILKIDSSDVQAEQVMQEDESFSPQFFVICCECSKKNIQRDIPPKIGQEILNRG